LPRRPLKSGGVPVDADLVAAFSIPVVAVIVALGVRKVRKMVARGVV
jgi:uncharacterized membrane-anchored protein